MEGETKAEKELPRSNPMNKLVLDDEKQKDLDDLKVRR
jgi:hypothetical protein